MCVVETRFGKLRGSREDGVSIFRGVPYARAPVGVRRFAEPAPPRPWGGVREALSFSSVAPQMGTEAGPIGKLMRAVRGGISEDCLCLNVWTSEVGGSDRPVLVFIHGGAFLLGAGSTFPYSGVRFAKSGLVVVTLNYRLGALGFLDLRAVAPDGGPPANLGLRDQLAALEWVRDNIAVFGGDPDNVTVYGESAGAMSIGALLGCRRQGPFRRAILSSGAAASVSSPAQAEAMGRRFLDLTGVAPGDWRRLRELPVELILQAQRRAMRFDLEAMEHLPWQPSVDDDLLPRPPLDSISDGAARDVELMIGTNAEEWRLFAIGLPALRWMSPKGLRTRVVKLLGATGGDPTRADELIAVHGGHGASREARYRAWISLRTEQIFLLPAVQLAEAQVGRGGVARFYRFDFRAPRLPRALGACHGLELGLVFGTWGHRLFRPVYGGGRAVDRLSERMGGLWSEFARSGIPTLGNERQWPAYSLPERTTAVLGTVPTNVRGPVLEHRSIWSSSTPLAPVI